MTCPSMETVSPFSLIVRDWPVVPNGMVSGIAEVVRRMARPVRTEMKRTMLGLEGLENVKDDQRKCLENAHKNRLKVCLRNVINFATEGKT